MLCSVFALLTVVNASAPLSVTLGRARAPSGKNVFVYSAEYSRSRELFRFVRIGHARWILELEPEASFEGGDSGAFSSLSAGVAAHFLWIQLQHDRRESYRKDSVPPDADDVGEDPSRPGYRLADTYRSALHRFHFYVPLAVRLESSAGFDDMAVLAELGLVPRYQELAGRSEWFSFLRHTRVALNLHGGRKVMSSDSTGEQTGSEWFARTVGEATAEYAPADTSGPFFRLSFGARAWIDVRGRFDYQLEGALQLMLDDHTSADLTYQRGSGPPCFAEGNQIGLGLTVRLGG